MLRSVASEIPTAILAVGGGGHGDRRGSRSGWSTRGPIGRAKADAARLGVGALDEVRADGMPVSAGSAGSARSVLQPDAWGGGQDAVTLPKRGASRGGTPAGRGRPAVPRACGGVLAGLRAMGRCPAGRPGGGLARGGQKGGLKAAFEAAVVAEIEALVGPGAVEDWDFEAIETSTRRRAMRVAARAVEQRFNADTSDHTGPTALCSCGQPARYAGRHAKTFQSALGELRLERAYYHCEACGSGFCPRDRALGLEGVSLSPAVSRMGGRGGAMVSFAEGSELMQELAAVAVDPKQVERTAEALGREIAQDERSVVEPEPPASPTMYLGMDGTGVPMRTSELEGREGKQPDGSAKTRQVKLVSVWSAEGRDEEGIPVRDPGSVTYSAAIESAASRDTDPEVSEFAKRAAREAARRGFDQAPRRVVLGDGAVWIWNIADEQFPGAIQIDRKSVV